MAKNKKPKFLEKETPELLDLLKKALEGDDVDIPKAVKITDELIARQPGEEPAMSVDEALHAAAEVMTGALNKVKGAYDNEVAMMEDSDGEDSEDSDDEEENEAPKKSSKKGKAEKAAPKSKGKKAKDEDEDEEDEEEEDSDDGDDEEEEDYSDWSIKDLKKECRTRGIKVTKGMAKSDMVKALEADDEE